MKQILSAVAFTFAMAGAANAAMVTFNGQAVNPATGEPTGAPASLTVETDNAPDSVTLAHGTFTGPNPPQIGDHFTNLETFDLSADPVELSGNGVNERILEIAFNPPLVNGPGYDIYIFETFDQGDTPTFALEIFGTRLLGEALIYLELDLGGFFEDEFVVWGFDFSDLGIADGATIGNAPDFSIFLRTGTNDGSADIAAILAANQAPIPLPAAAPLFFAGLAGLGFAIGRKRRKV